MAFRDLGSGTQVVQGRVPPPSKRIHSTAMLICAPLSGFRRDGNPVATYRPDPLLPPETPTLQSLSIPRQSGTDPRGALGGSGRAPHKPGPPGMAMPGAVSLWGFKGGTAPYPASAGMTIPAPPTPPIPCPARNAHVAVTVNTPPVRHGPAGGIGERRRGPPTNRARPAWQCRVPFPCGGSKGAAPPFRLPPG